jgi:two-component system, sensor histidine kinase
VIPSLTLPRPATDGAAPAAGEAAPDHTADHIRTLYEQTSVTLAGTAVGLVLIAAMFHGLAHPLALWGWFAAVLALIALRVAMYLRFPKGDDVPLARLVAWRRQWNVVVLASAAGWGAAVWLFYGLGSNFHLQALILIVYSYMLAGVQLLAPQPRVYLGFIGLGMLPTIVRVALDANDPFHLQLAVVMSLVCALTVGLALVYRRAFESTIALKVRTERLAAQLAEEKAQAEAARRDAEVANRAKTQFFAAASHDLRQPLHALGLFAEALRGRSQDDEVLQLVNSINSSVDALEGLFSELLDITRIDSGGVEVRPQHFHVGELFGRLRLHFEPTAFEKGLRLAFRGGAHHAHADPLLVDRILRNLVSNAIRYTDDGTVLVGCRRRGGRLLLQVWDTGVGIGALEQERIFEEFYQVSDGSVLPPDQRKGLGLGLAIVERLAALMGAPLGLRSEPGRGTVFTLELPLGRAARPQAPALPGSASAGLALGGRQIVVVEDEPAVRLGLEVLLKSWGATVKSFDSVAACEAWTLEVAADAPPPALLIVDYRLEGGRTGIEAIRALRQRFGAGVPAIVVTGSTLSDHASAAQAHAFHLLVKPVLPNKLKAMIAFKLGLR